MTPKNTKSKTIIYSKTQVMSKENDQQSNISQQIPLNLINILKKKSPVVGSSTDAISQNTDELVRPGLI